MRSKGRDQWLIFRIIRLWFAFGLIPGLAIGAFVLYAQSEDVYWRRIDPEEFAWIFVTVFFIWNLIAFFPIMTRAGKETDRLIELGWMSRKRLAALGESLVSSTPASYKGYFGVLTLTPRQLLMIPHVPRPLDVQFSLPLSRLSTVEFEEPSGLRALMAFAFLLKGRLRLKDSEGQAYVFDVGNPGGFHEALTNTWAHFKKRRGDAS